VNISMTLVNNLQNSISLDESEEGNPRVFVYSVEIENTVSTRVAAWKIKEVYYKKITQLD
jgi:hypothetical protein